MANPNQKTTLKTMPQSPYLNLPRRAYWRTAVSKAASHQFGDFYHPKFTISKEMGIMTAGSCFAQHIGRVLRETGFNVIDTERLPEYVSEDNAKLRGYRLYSARYGNIYTSRQLIQLMRETFDGYKPTEDVWKKDTKYFDAQRPGIEPQGFSSPEEVRALRAEHLKKVREAVEKCDLAVFTFGLTEAWVYASTGDVYPTAPGTIAGSFDSEVYQFHNYSVTEIYQDFIEFRDRLRKINPKVKFLVSVSPVPLTATASGQHVQVASCYSKSVLRAVCGMIYEEFEDVDYYPSYELITSSGFDGEYYASNKRSVSDVGVQIAMRTFLTAHGHSVVEETGHTLPHIVSNDVDDSDDLVCEEAMLDSFADKK